MGTLARRSNVSSAVIIRKPEETLYCLEHRQLTIAEESAAGITRVLPQGSEGAVLYLQEHRGARLKVGRATPMFHFQRHEAIRSFAYPARRRGPTLLPLSSFGSEPSPTKQPNGGVQRAAPLTTSAMVAESRSAATDVELSAPRR